VAHEALAMERANELSRGIIGAAIEVHRSLGPGLLESTYEACLCHKLAAQGIPFERQAPLPVIYKGLNIDCAYKIDLKVGGLVIVELKAVEKVERIHEAQLMTYLRLSNLWLGLLMNFNVLVLKDGIKRLVNG
jgi:GxxExxY protein